MQIIYAVEQERTLRKPFGSQELSLYDRGVSRLGILDDQYLGALASDLIALWPEFVALLAESGHTVQVLKTGPLPRHGQVSRMKLCPLDSRSYLL